MGSHFIRRILYFAREEGLKMFAVRALKQVISPIAKYKRVFILERSLHQDIPPCSSKVHIQVRQIHLQEDDLQLLGELMYHDRAYVEKNLMVGKRCFVAKVHGRIAHYIWLSFEKEYIPEIDNVLVLGEKEAYAFNARTLRTFRGHNILPTVLTEMFLFLKDTGYERVFSSISPRNTASLKQAEKMGFRKVCVITYFKFFPLKKYICKNSNEEKCQVLDSATGTIKIKSCKYSDPIECGTILQP